MEDRDVGRRHVGQMLQQPEREDRLRPSLGEPRHVEAAVWRPRFEGSESTSSPTSIGVIPVPMHTPNRPGSSCSVSRPESSTAMAAAPTANRTARLISFTFFLMLSQIGKDVEVLDLAGDLDRAGPWCRSSRYNRRRNAPRRSPRRTRGGQSRWARPHRFRSRPRGACCSPTLVRRVIWSAVWDSRSLILSFPFFWRYTGLDPSACVTMPTPRSPGSNRKLPEPERLTGVFPR